jgi:hypothetical protein
VAAVGVEEEQVVVAVAVVVVEVVVVEEDVAEVVVVIMIKKKLHRPARALSWLRKKRSRRVVPSSRNAFVSII